MRTLASLLYGAAVLAFGAQPAVADGTERVSVDSAGNQGNSGSFEPSISADGRHVAFRSYASNLVPGDTAARWDIFVHDRSLGTTERVSIDSAGVQGNFDSFEPSISADGRYVAFRSYASNLVPGDTNVRWDVFVHDRATGATERVSIDSAGRQGNANSVGPAISADGRYVAFWSYADNLVPGDSNGRSDVFVHDRERGTTARVSVDSAGQQAGADSYEPSISADGRYVAFWSHAEDLVPGDANGAADVFVHDRETGTTERVSIGGAGNQGDLNSYEAAISADGRHVAFRSYASNLVPGDTNATGDIFVRDLAAGTTERVSVDSAGHQATLESRAPSLSADGRYVAFRSYAYDLVAGDSNATYDVFLHDRLTGTAERVSVDGAGNQGNNSSQSPVGGGALSADGGAVAFFSYASNLVPDDTNDTWDVFVRARDLEPTGGFVTGGGHIASPAGAYAPGPILTGRVTFGLVSKPETAADTGKIRLRFRAAGLDFESHRIQWLAIAGPHARIKGVGTINGAGAYGFRVFATDGRVDGGGGVDRFRIKIWDLATDAVIYDNEMGGAGDVEPTTPLSGGSIQIHRPPGRSS